MNPRTTFWAIWLLPLAASAERPAPPPRGEQVTLHLTTQPRVKAKVMWGRKNLGVTPLHLLRPRDSGPLDLVIVAQGYVPVHTRMYTFGDDKLSVRLTPQDQKQALFGYKREVPPPAPPQPDPQPAQPQVTPAAPAQPQGAPAQPQGAPAQPIPHPAQPQP